MNEEEIINNEIDKIVNKIKNKSYKKLKDISEYTGKEIEDIRDIIDEIPIERKVYGCEDGSICCFNCVGKENCSNCFIK